MTPKTLFLLYSGIDRVEVIEYKLSQEFFSEISLTLLPSDTLLKCSRLNSYFTETYTVIVQ